MAPRSLVPSVFGRFPRALDDWFPAMPDVDRLFGEMSRGLPVGRAGETGLMAPRIDVAETDTEIHITAEIPGVDPTDVDVSLVETVLQIKAEKRAEKDRDDKNLHVSERCYGMFMRQIPLGFEPAADSVHASFDKGVLSIAIAKPAAPKPVERKIAITKPASESGGRKMPS